MKNQIAIVALSLTAAYSSFGQGEVSFNAGTATKISVNTQGAPSTFAAINGGANAYYFALFSSVSGTSENGNSAAVVGAAAANNTAASYVISDNTWTFDGYAASVAQVGRFAATTVDTANYTQIPGQPASAQFVIIGWSANIGSTVASLTSFFANNGPANGFVGESAISGNIGTGTAGTLNSPPSLLGGSAPSIPAFDLGYTQPTPEPTTLALAGLGGLSLLAFRRKKA